MTARAIVRSKLGWRGRLTGWLMGAAGGMAINDFSNALGYRGLAGVFAVVAVVAASAWIARVTLPHFCHTPQPQSAPGSSGT